MNETPERAFGNLTVRIERTECIGSGNCVNLASEVFELDEDNLVAFRDDAEAIASERLEEACVICPVDALLVFDEDGEQVVP